MYNQTPYEERRANVQRSDMYSGGLLAGLAGFGVGILAMYLLDPERAGQG